MALDSFFSQKVEPHLETLGPVGMHESKDSIENTGIEVNNGNLAHRRRLSNLRDDLASGRPRLDCVKSIPAQSHLPPPPPTSLLNTDISVLASCLRT